MRWTRRVPRTCGTGCGRPSRMVLTPQRLASSWRSSASDGVSKARSPGRVRSNRKPLRGECRVDSWCDRGDYPGAAFFSARQLRAHWAPGIPCALSLEGPTILASLARKTCGENAEPRHCEEHSRRSNPFLLAARWIASRSLSSGARSRDPLAGNDGVQSPSRNLAISGPSRLEKSSLQGYSPGSGVCNSQSFSRPKSSSALASTITVENLIMGSPP